MVAEKVYSDEVTPVEVYSLASHIPIHDLRNIEAKLIVFLDYRLMVSERDF